MILDDLLEYDIDDYIVELIMSNYDFSQDSYLRIEPRPIITPTGYMSKKEFLMKVCNCEKVVGLTEKNSKKAKIVFDESKVIKPFEEYLEEYNYKNLYVPEEERVYCSIDFLNAHKIKKESNSNNSKRNKIKEKRARKVKVG